MKQETNLFYDHSDSKVQCVLKVLTCIPSPLLYTLHDFTNLPIWVQWFHIKKDLSEFILAGNFRNYRICNQNTAGSVWNIEILEALDLLSHNNPLCKCLTNQIHWPAVLYNLNLHVKNLQKTAVQYVFLAKKDRYVYHPQI